MRHAYIELTNSCNQDCLFCIRPRKIIQTLDAEEARKMILKLKDHDLMIFTGGEPTVHKDLPQLIQFAKNNKIKRVQIQSNVVRFSDVNYLTQVFNAGLDQVNIAFHTHIKNVYNEITQSDTFEKHIQGINNIQRFVKLNLAIIIHNLNIGTLFESVRYLLNNYDIDEIAFIFIRPEQAALNHKKIIPRYSEIELDLHKILDFCSHKVRFNIEYVPLCYLAGFEEKSVDSQRIIHDQKMNNYWLENKKTRNEDIGFLSDQYTHAPQCKLCVHYKVCPGVRLSYAGLFGTNELYPVFENAGNPLNKSM